MPNFKEKRVSDPVHKTIGLSALEAEIISSPAFQRLQKINQLGLAHLVFPGANYSRFAHSLGVRHITGQILDSVVAYTPELSLNDDDRQLYRLAALLHDVGHYPFSHATEEAIKDYYAESLLDDRNKSSPSPDGVSSIAADKIFNHERCGRAVLEHDSVITEILRRYGIEPRQVSAVFMRESAAKLNNLVSSDLDADRIDYLLRTAHHAGLPYGSVDIEYILTQTRIDSAGRICLDAKALTAADHFLLCRYFDYQQVAYHKTVVSLESLLKEVVSALLREGFVQLSGKNIIKMIEENKWNEFDDGFMIDAIRRYAQTGCDPIDKTKAKAILERRPPKLVYEWQMIAGQEPARQAHFRLLRKFLREKVPLWAEQFQIDKGLWWIWDKAGLTLTKIGSHVPVATVSDVEAEEKDRYEQAVRIRDADGSSTEIMALEGSLMNLLSNYAWYCLRLYILLPESELEMRDAIKEAIKKDMRH